MSGGYAYAKRPRADGEPQRRTQEDRLSIDTGGHSLGREDLKGRCAPGMPRRMSVIRCVENEDAQQAAVERRSGAEARTTTVRQRIRVVRHQHDGELSVLTPCIIDQAERRRLATGAKHRFCRLHQGAHFGVAIARLADRFTVDTEGDIVQEHPAVHFGQVDPALYCIAERVERTCHVMPVHPEVERKVVSCPRGDADERQLVGSCGCCHDGKGPIATSHAHRIRALVYRVVDVFHQALARVEDDHLDPALLGLFGDACTTSRATARPWVDKQHRPSWWLGRTPAITGQSRLGRSTHPGRRRARHDAVRP